MIPTWFAAIEDALDKLNGPPEPDPRKAELLNERMRELKERGAPLPEADEQLSRRTALVAQFLYGAEGPAPLVFELSRQHWASPYDNDYLVVTPGDVAFKPWDVLALSNTEELSWSDLKSASNGPASPVVLDMVRPAALRGKAWITRVTVAQASAAGAVYLHHFFAAEGAPGEGARLRSNSREIFQSTAQLREIANPSNVDGIAVSPHPAIAPRETPGRRVSSALGDTASQQVYNRIFLTLTNQTMGGVVVMLNVEMKPGVTPDPSDYLALSSGKPTNADDYMTYQWVTELVDGTHYETYIDCSQGGLGFMANLNKLSGMYIFYGRRVNGQDVILGTPTSFELQPSWMEKSLAVIGAKKLHEIVLPGSHDAGTWDPTLGPFLGGNAMAQNLNFSDQLALGMRYLDCRLQNWPSKSQPYYFYHGIGMWSEITDLTSALKSFVAQSRDIVVLDFSRFDGFGATDYTKFFNLFWNDPVLGPLIITANEAAGLTLRDLYALGKRLLLLSDNATAQTNYHMPASINLHSQWAQTWRIADLKTFLADQYTAHASFTKMWSLQGILTPRGADWISDWSKVVNPVIGPWVESLWWDRVNVVFNDDVAGADMVHTAIVCNEKRATPNRGDLFWFEQVDWRTGGNSWRGGPGTPPAGADGWDQFKAVFATSDGVIYALRWDGNLYWYKHTGWQNGSPTWQGGLAKPPVQTGWTQFKSVFATSDGVIYAITWDGKLNWYKHTDWQNGSPTWASGSGTPVGDSGWAQFKSVFATSDGVIYALKWDGNLYWYKHTGWQTGSPTWAGGLTTPPVKTGWGEYKSVFATSDGVIYAITWDGKLHWYKHTGWQTGSPTWAGAPGAPPVDAGWENFPLAFATSDGRLYAVKV